MKDQMLFASAITRKRDVLEAGQALADQIKAQLKGQSLDLAFVFLSPHFRVIAGELVHQLRTALNPTVLLGCTAEGVIGRDHEIEREPALAIVAAHLPGVELSPFLLQSMDWQRTLSEEAAL